VKNIIEVFFCNFFDCSNLISPFLIKNLIAFPAREVKIATEKVQISTLAIHFSKYTPTVHSLFSLNIVFNFFLNFFFISLFLWSPSHSPVSPNPIFFHRKLAGLRTWLAENHPGWVRGDDPLSIGSSGSRVLRFSHSLLIFRSITIVCS
jgi:hypothetical protein